MKRIIFAILIVLGLSVNQAEAQLSDKLVPHLGFMYQVANFENSGVEDRTIFYTINLGTYYTLAHSNDVVSVGIDPSLQFGLNLVGNGYVNYIIQTPVFLMGRVGANSTAYNEQKIGAGLGIGGNYTYFSQKLDTNTRRNVGFFSPSVVGEVTILSGGSPLTFRAHFSFVDTNSEMKFKRDNGGDSVQEASFGNFGFGLIYGF